MNASPAVRTITTETPMNPSPVVRTITTETGAFSMAELVAKTGVAPSTIRYYISTGLLAPGRKMAPNHFLYDERHVESLRLIRLLKERRRLPLEAVRRILPELLQLPADGAFRPEMWDLVVETRERSAARSSPGARLLQAGIAAFDRFGYAEVRVDDVCRAAKIAKGSFYRHFTSKEELFFAAARSVAAQAIHRFADAAEDGPVGREAATELLSESLAEHIALLLDLIALAAQHRPGHGRVLREIFRDLHRAIGSRLDPLAPASAAEEVLENALMSGIRQVVGSPLLQAELFPGEAGH